MSSTAHEREPYLPAALGVDPAVGLSAKEVAERQRVYGPNALATQRPEQLWQRLLRGLREPMALLLLGAGLVYLLLGQQRDAIIMFVALVPIVGVDYVLEERAQRTLERLKGLVAPRATVLREGRTQTIPSVELVPGDVVVVHEGDILAADGLLVAGSDIRVDESSLTGEAFPVAKLPRASGQDSVLFAGTTLVSGRGTVVLTATGSDSEYGRIGRLVAESAPRPTPTQRAIADIVRKLALAAAVLVLAVVAISLLRRAGWIDALSAGVSLGIAVIPEEFPVVFTLYLTLGAWRMAKRRALVRRLPAVETLGSVGVICADKTGTLTQGKMSLTALFAGGSIKRIADVPADPEVVALLEAAVLASEPQPYDPLEQSLLEFAQRARVDIAALYARWELVQEYPFEPGRKAVTHVWRRRDGALRLCTKGAFEGIVSRSLITAPRREELELALQTLARNGMRVLAVAEKQIGRYTGQRDADEIDLNLVGLIGFTDPERPNVRESIAECQAAGIRVVMITGDHPLTAHNVAEAIGLRHDDRYIITGDRLDRLDDSHLRHILPVAGIFARISPAQKHRLVRALKSAGETVAMTGDGINDAPALREADVGVAMGQRGTEVAREAAALVLLDDNFRTIVTAIREGRRIFDNLRHVFHYLVAFHIPILVPALFVPILGAPLLLLPAHLVWLELLLHPTSSLVFEADPPAADLMRRPPRSSADPFLLPSLTLRSLLEGLSVAAAVLALYLVSLRDGVPLSESRALALTTLVIAQLLLVLVERSPHRPFWSAGPRPNKFLWPILGAGLASLFAFLYIPALAPVMGLTPLSLAGIGLAISVAAACLLPLELTKYLHRGI